MSYRTIVFLFALLIAFLPLGNIRAAVVCSELGCESGVIIEVPQDYRWKPGNYRFRFSLDNKKIVCKGKLPLPSCGAPSVSCDREGMLIMEVGCALDQGLQGFGRITTGNFPEKIHLEVFRGKAKIGQLLVFPTYTESSPNGRKCAPLCRQARLQLDLK